MHMHVVGISQLYLATEYTTPTDLSRQILD